ncbi:hypothetical protein HS088_TW10G00542 [Tripterygium wilfordii]|uniref:Uncharacterized protein n=1 Tax=Tripterygium wilfordii TaxID=458696 RepID=A0A7J7D5E3_TRIWF|nr:uncharacterized protein LOC120007086 [Tripterygium wilfordii]KAF5741542.1 hypothetical protein HS088_TW10G00542 [Tripterygium wilfordii]
MVVLLSPDTGNGDVSNANLPETPRFSEDIDSTCSTPYVSAPSSPGREASYGGGYFFSAPASPMHFVLCSAPSATCPHSNSAYLSPQSDTSFEFEVTSRSSGGGSVAVGSMSSADELFLNGHIRPMKLSSHLQRPQNLAPLLDLDEEEDYEDDNGEQYNKRQQAAERGRDLKLRSRSLHRKARSLSPLRNSTFQWREEDCREELEVSERILELKDFERKQTERVSSETTPSVSASSSRSSSSGRNSKKWIFLKDLLNRSKSEGRGNGKEKFWSSISFSPSKDKKVALPSLSPSKIEKPPLSSSATTETTPTTPHKHKRKEQGSSKKSSSTKPTNGVSKRRLPLSPHELHYTANRAQAEEMKKRTYLPYRHGLFGCLGFSLKGYGALNGLARSFNPVSSR